MRKNMAINERIIQDKLTDLVYRINNSMDMYGFFAGVTLDRGTHTFVEPVKYGFGKFRITVDMDDVEMYADDCGITDLESAKVLVTHEIMHVLLKHFKKDYRKWNHEIYNLAADCEVNSYLDMRGPSIRAEQFGLPDFLKITDYYHFIKKQSDEQKKNEPRISIAISIPMDSGNSDGNSSDSQSNAQSSASQTTQKEKTQSESPSNPNSKDSYEVYEFIDMNDDDFQDDENDNNSDDEATDSQNNSAVKNDDEKSDDNNADNDEQRQSSNGSNDVDDSASEEMKKRLERSNCSSLTDRYSDEEAEEIESIVESSNIGTGTVQRAAQIASRAIERTMNKANIEGLDELMRKLERKERTMSITPHDRKETYMKLNNRRKNGTIILPGKRLENDGLKKKFDTSLTVFIDMSGSTMDINETLMNVAYRFYKLGATIIYYDNNILDTVKPSERFRLMDSRGGTNIKDVLTEYLATGEKIDRAYVITDGEDYFYALDEVVPKYTIYRIKHNAIKEIYSDKNPCTDKFGWY